MPATRRDREGFDEHQGRARAGRLPALHRPVDPRRDGGQTHLRSLHVEPGGSGSVPDSFAIANADPDTRAYAHAGRDTDDPVPDGDAAALPHAYQEALADVADGPAVSAVLACVDEAGRVLIVKQTAGPFAGAWLLPGGRVERDESPDDTARRELREETGYTVNDL